MASSVIAPLTLPIGAQIFGPFSAPAAWHHAALSLDISGLTTADVVMEFSTNSGANWAHLVSEIGLKVGLNRIGVPVTSEILAADWGGTLPAGLIRATVTSTALFLSNGGSFTVS